MSAEVFEITQEEQQAFSDVLNSLEAEPANISSGSIVPTAPQPCDIPALRERLAVLVSRGKAKETIGVQPSHKQVKRLSEKEVEKYAKRYQAYVGSKTTKSLQDGAISFISKVFGMVVDIDVGTVAT